MNNLQKETIKELQKILPQAHFINIKVRIDGEWREYEADFLKEILAGRVEPEVILQLAEVNRVIGEIIETKKNMNFTAEIPTAFVAGGVDALIELKDKLNKAQVKPACETAIRIDELNKLQQTLNPYQMNENDFFRAAMDGTIKNIILARINELSKSV